MSTSGCSREPHQDELFCVAVPHRDACTLVRLARKPNRGARFHDWRKPNLTWGMQKGEIAPIWRIATQLRSPLAQAPPPFMLDVGPCKSHT